jgi:mevalonate pyrophosphate decarboxylase
VDSHQISYSVVVAEEQAREAANGDLPLLDGFIPASSAAAEAAVELAIKQETEEAEKKIHPMFRRLSSSSSRSRSSSISIEEKPRKRRKVNTDRIDEEVIEDGPKVQVADARDEADKTKCFHRSAQA